MSNIFNGTWPQSAANIRPSGASLILAKVSGDAAYYSLGAPRDVKIDVMGIGKDDTLLRQLSWGAKPEITVPTLACAYKNIVLLTKLITGIPVAWGITELDAGILKDDGTKIGMRWKLTCGGRFDDFRMIEYIFGGNLDRSELDALFTNTPLTLGSPATDDTLYSLAQTAVAADDKPNGLRKFEFKASTDDDYADFGEFEDSQLTIECLGPFSGGGRQIPRTSAIKVSGTVKGLQTSLTEKQLMDSMLDNFMNVKLTFMDGLVLEVPHTNIGFAPSYKNEGNADKWRNIELAFGGALCPKSDGSDFETTGGTTWASLWTAP